MRILLAHNSLYFPSHGGGDKSNRLLMEAMASHRHQVQVMARLENFSEPEHLNFLRDLEFRGIQPGFIRDGAVAFTRNGVQIFTATRNPLLRQAFAARIEEFDPDVILCSTDDPGGLLLDVALRAPRARVVYLVRATVAVPFGPDCAFPNRVKTEDLGRVDSIVGVSEYVAEYVRRHSGLPAIHVPISLLEPGDYSAMGGFENEFVLMVNPCAVKGISIFTALAAAMPELTFAAVPTWGTNPHDLEALRAHANIRIFEPVDDVAVLLRRTSVVLVPSVWAEARSRMVVESMIRAIPVMASDVGGLHEAKLGVEYLLPVNPIQRYHARVDTNMVPVAEVPPQDIGPWKAALSRLTRERDHYLDIASRSREAALAYAECLHSGLLENHLEELLHKPKISPAVASPKVAGLSAAKRELLALRLKNSRAAAPKDRLFPDVPESDKPILFCFPWAGGGTTVYRSWREPLADLARVAPIRLPGRESRIDEAPYISMEELTDAIANSLLPYLSQDFVFYGHSMGAGAAFEVARKLRRGSRRMPSKLILASARAPQLRAAPARSHPSDMELIEQIRRLNSLPEESEIIQLVLPALRADTRLYRDWVFEPETPLDIPILTLFGVEDPALTAGQVSLWSVQTTGASSFHEMPGGHVFPLSHPHETIAAIRQCLLF